MTERFIDVVLADPSHRLPLPGSASLFPETGARVDTWDPFWLILLADGSLMPAPAAAPAPAAPAPEHDA
jgi:hypothetical protein